MKMFDFLLGSATVVHVSAADALKMKMFEIFLGSIILLFVLYQLVDFIVCDSTGDEPERWECWAITIGYFITIICVVVLIIR